MHRNDGRTDLADIKTSQVLLEAAYTQVQGEGGGSGGRGVSKVSQPVACYPPALKKNI